MRMSHFVVREAIQPNLTATTREGIVEELVRSLHATGRILESDLDEVVKAILRREQLGSTGIGRGVAIPHTRHSAVNQLIGTVGISHAGVNYDAVDGERVHVFVMLVSPQDQPGNHLRALENVVQSFRDEEFLKAIRTATTQDQIWDLIDGVKNW
jgi:nitrogen PTS system EIIA component